MGFTVEKQKNYAVLGAGEEAGNKLNTQLGLMLREILVELTSDGHKSIILDMSGFPYCDSSGLSAILAGYRLCERFGGKFVLAELSPTVEKLIQMTRLDEILTVTKGIPQAREIASA